MRCDATLLGELDGASLELAVGAGQLGLFSPPQGVSAHISPIQEALYIIYMLFSGMNRRTGRNRVTKIPSDPSAQAFRQAFLVPKLVPALGAVTANALPPASLSLEMFSKGYGTSLRVSHASDKQQTSTTGALLEAEASKRCSHDQCPPCRFCGLIIHIEVFGIISLVYSTEYARTRGTRLQRHFGGIPFWAAHGTLALHSVTQSLNQVFIC